ncbi:hypothetical protein CERZMDRAFT_103359 [Cercospora zeae-maydis SCOH1-5]|uniref:Uncharacterized protein n=1 Tax=Cercospora zeae-maydis SCOH1-5 TaxID=717836 RepID=A0A6A6EYH3_9PEZI|nr:hypothetical protein CERZMDRAFT_103359 [Cercospora zeae-maydis SCOH1-5]
MSALSAPPTRFLNILAGDRAEDISSNVPRLQIPVPHTVTFGDEPHGVQEYEFTNTENGLASSGEDALEQTPASKMSSEQLSELDYREFDGTLGPHDYIANPAFERTVLIHPDTVT